MTSETTRPSNGGTVSPKPHDVLLGRGCGASEFPGNRHFRELVEQRKEEYTSNSRFEPKKRIAKEIVDQIHSLGGRFLRLVESNGQMVSIVEEGKWEEVEEKVALEKCKQGLREKAKSSNVNKANGTVKGPSTEKETNGSATLHSAGIPMEAPQASLSVEEVASRAPPTTTQPVVSPNTFAFGIGGPSVVDPRLLLYQNYASLPQIHMQILPLPIDVLARFQNIQAQLPNATQQGLNTPNQAPQGGLAFSSVHSQLPTAPPTDQANVFEMSGTNKNHPADIVDVPSLSRNSSSTESSDNEDVMLALSALSVADRPRFSAQEEERERALLTDEEKAEILADTFGKKCAVNSVGPRQKKKARTDLDLDSIKFLVSFMRAEIEKIPSIKKQALLEAQRKCDAAEFDNVRLERFLRCEGMNAKSAAQRFVNYWESRREVFGPDKYWQRMTLAEALRDDIAAIEAGVYCQLPFLDSSGRQLLWLEPHRHTKQGYTSESLLRAYWYLIEVTSTENKHSGSGCITIVWDYHSTFWDFDRHVYESITRFENTSWPIKMIAHHVCCSPRFIGAIMKSIFFAKTDKRARARTMFHDVPKEEIVENLSHYGISEDLLPTDMGGTLDFKQSEWIAHRRAVEMEEI